MPYDKALRLAEDNKHQMYVNDKKEKKRTTKSNHDVTSDSVVKKESSYHPYKKPSVIGPTNIKSQVRYPPGRPSRDRINNAKDQHPFNLPLRWRRVR